MKSFDDDDRRQELLVALSLWSNIRNSAEGRALQESMIKQLCGIVEEWLRCDPNDTMRMVSLRGEATTLVTMLNHEYGVWRMVMGTIQPGEKLDLPQPPDWKQHLLNLVGLGKRPQPR